MTVQAIQSEALNCVTYEVYCPVCGEWIPVEMYDDEQVVYFHNENPHDDYDYEALDYGIN